MIKVFKPREVARLLGIRDATVYALITSGQLKARDVGEKRSSWRITEEAVQDYLNGDGEPQPAAPKRKRRKQRRQEKVFF